MGYRSSALQLSTGSHCGFHHVGACDKYWHANSIDLCNREGSVSSKYFWLTQYWRLWPVTLVQLSQFSIFTTSPRSPNHSQSRVCKYLTLIELSILWMTARHLWTRALCHQECGDKQLILTHSDGIFFPIFYAFYSSSHVASASIWCEYLLRVWCVDSAGPGAQSWPAPGPGSKCLLW